MSVRIWQFRCSRALGRLATRLAAEMTLRRMPPFVSTSAVIVDADRLLVVIDPIRREPILPGGHLRWREKPRDGVIREVREETGYTVRPDALLDVVAGEEWAGEAGVVRVIYVATVIGGSLASSPEGEARWALLSDVAESKTRDAPVVRLWLERGAATSGLV